MRVIVTKDSGHICSVAHPERLDLREEPGAIERIDVARQHPALRGLLLNLNADESPFSTFGCKVWAATEGTGVEPEVFASRIGLVVWQGAEELGQAQYEDLANRLAELLSGERRVTMLCGSGCQREAPGGAIAHGEACRGVCADGLGTTEARMER